MRKALTDRYVASVKPDADIAQVDVFDVGHSGLALRVGHRDKVWTFHHRVGGKLKRVRLGRYPEMTLAEARGAWLMARKGMLPVMAAVTTNKAAPTIVQVVLAEWLASWRIGKSDNTAKQYESHAKLYLTPAWGERSIESITKRDVLSLLDGIKAQGKITQTLAVFATLRVFFGWCLRREIITVDPIAGLKRSDIGKKVERDRVLSDDELCKLMAHIRGAYQFDPYLAATHLLMLTAARSDMIASLRWDEVNGEVISLPAERMKTKQAFDLPITPQMRAVLDSVPRISGCPFVFGKPLASWDNAKQKLDAATGIVDWQFRDIRRTVSTGMQRLGISAEVIDAVQAHAKTGIKKVYQRHNYAAEKRDALEKWGSYVTSLIHRP
jgi:integrase